MTDPRVQDVIGPLARLVHIDCTVSEIPTAQHVGREIKRLFDSSPVGRTAFGIYFVTNARGDRLYGVRPCGCARFVDVRNAADLVRMIGRDDFLDRDADLRRLEVAVARFRAHRAWRERADGTPEPTWPDPLTEIYGCRMVDGGRPSHLTLGVLEAAGGSPLGLGHVLDPVDSTNFELREIYLAALTRAALREDPFPEAAGPHLALTYLMLAAHEIVPAVEAACAARGCRPEDLPLHALPVPRAARERAALLVCTSRGLPASDGAEALAALRREHAAAGVGA